MSTKGTMNVAKPNTIKRYLLRLRLLLSISRAAKNMM